MIKNLALCSLLLLNISAHASEIINLTIKNGSQINTSTVQLIYHSAPNILCGKFKKGSYVSKKHFENIKFANNFEVKKNLRFGLCSYKLSYVTLLAPNWVNYEVEVVDVPVLNKYSSKVLRRRPSRDTFYFLCSTRKEAFGCRGNRTVADIENTHLDIHLNDE